MMVRRVNNPLTISKGGYVMRTKEVLDRLITEAREELKVLKYKLERCEANAVPESERWYYRGQLERLRAHIDDLTYVWAICGGTND